MIIDIAKQYTTTPGARYITDGDFSGEEFRQKFLEPEFKKTSAGKITVILDGTEGFATSFLEEAFGGLAREFGSSICLARLDFISNDDPLLIEEIQSYISDVANEKSRVMQRTRKSQETVGRLLQRFGFTMMGTLTSSPPLRSYSYG